VDRSLNSNQLGVNGLSAALPAFLCKAVQAFPSLGAVRRDPKAVDLPFHAEYFLDSSLDLTSTPNPDTKFRGRMRRLPNELSSLNVVLAQFALKFRH
jgi:hypothetical protein